MRILVVDNVRFTAELIAAALLLEPAMQAADIALSVEQAYELLAAHTYDECLVNGALPDGAALTLTRYTAENHPQTHVLVYGLENLDALVLSFFEAGAVGYLSSEDGAAKLVKAVQAAANGEAFAPPHLTRLFMSRLAELTALLDDMAMEPERYAELTASQKEVLQLIADGLTNEEIADHLIVAVGTVKSHVHNILDKLNLVSRQDAATYLSLVKAAA